MDGHKPQLTTVLFDMDGTLVDSMDVHSEALAAVLRDHLGLEKDPAELRQIISGRLTAETLAFFASDGLDVLARAWMEYEIPLQDRLQLYPGVRAALDALARAGVHMGVVTSQGRREMEAMRGFVKLDGLIGAWVSSDDVARAKPAPDPILVALERLGGQAEQAIMVGDTHFDLLAGQSAGVLTAVAGWNPEALATLAAQEALGPDYIFHTPQEMVQLIVGVA